MHRLSIISLILATLLAACTPYMYGVPQETWDRMSEPERIEAMRVYEREQQARRQAAEERRRAAEERARLQALEREQERARQAALERERQERIEALHLGMGAYGELIRVRLQGGQIRIGDRHHRYQPLTFTIADGETRRIGVADYKGREVELTVTYAGGALNIEGLRFPYERRWGRGVLYAETGSSGPLALQGVDVFVEVRNRSSRFEREQPRLVLIREEPPVMIREREPVRPQVVIVHEKEGPKPPPVADRQKQNPAPPAAPVRQPPPPQPVRQPVPVVAERAPRALSVAFLSGELKVRGQKQVVEKATMRIAEGESREFTVKAGSESRTIPLQYLNGDLILDGTVGKGRNGARFHFEKEWKTGKLYRFDLKGRVLLEKIEMKVTGVE